MLSWRAIWAVAIPYPHDVCAPSEFKSESLPSPTSVQRTGNFGVTKHAHDFALNLNLTVHLLAKATSADGPNHKYSTQNPFILSKSPFCIQSFLRLNRDLERVHFKRHWSESEGVSGRALHLARSWCHVDHISNARRVKHDRRRASLEIKGAGTAVSW